MVSFHNKAETFSEDDFSSSSNDDSGQTEEQAQEVLVKRETSLVTCFKLIVFLVLASSAAVMGYFAYDTLRSEEIDDFEVQFRYDANEVLHNSKSNGEAMRNTVATFSGLYTSYAKNSVDHDFPNVTLPDFEAFASKTMTQGGGILLLSYSPLVTATTREGWETYATETAQTWLRESFEFAGLPYSEQPISPYIYKKTLRSAVPEDGEGPFSPVWQLSPPPTDTTVINFNLFNAPIFRRLVEFSIYTREAAISEVLNTEIMFGASAPQSGDHPQSILVNPVFNKWKDGETVGHTIAVITWRSFLEDLLQTGQPPIEVVLRESCGDAFTYRIEGPEAIFKGLGDFHDSSYDHLMESSGFLDYDGENSLEGISGLTDHCQYTIEVYPTKEYEDSFTTNQPKLFTGAVILIFFFASSVFILYSCLVDIRQKKVHDTAIRAKSIVRSLFPQEVAEKLQQEREEKNKRDAERKKKARKGSSWAVGMDEDEDCTEEHETEIADSNQMAEFYPSVTILFADIAGFTAWSSVREPSQVFVLLETLYQAFDKIAVKRKIFKVETIGDCYVAVCGLPTPNKDHAIQMCRFAIESRARMIHLRGKLERRLGPDTGDLAMRFGLHSGAVTAGVLRGDRARFQLFGDTMNTASRMESNGVRDKIHLSDETAQILIAAGKGHWIVPREDKIVAKGKGELSTWWLRTETALKHSSTMGSSDDGSSETASNVDTTETETNFYDTPRLDSVDKKVQRMIDWNCEMLLQGLKAVVASRQVDGGSPRTRKDFVSAEMSAELMLGDSTPIDELKDHLAFSEAKGGAAGAVNLDAKVIAQLRGFVSVIATMYRPQEFHDFEHASHVTMSAVKLLARCTTAKKEPAAETSCSDAIMEDSGECTEELKVKFEPDPLSRFAIIFAALIHDVDHEGCPNFILAKERPALQNAYNGRSIAEQNSVDCAWKVLMNEEFRDLRNAIYINESEMNRFRQVIVTAVMATDIFDPEHVKSRERRFNRVFNNKGASVKSSLSNTVILENLIQASDIAHTMQHWNVYCKWNERLFREMYKLHAQGRMSKDPSAGWFEGEIKFFEGVVLPLASRLGQCQVFGVSSMECLDNAKKNLAQWKRQGKQVVEGFQKNLAENPLKI